MISIQKGEDLLSISLNSILGYRKNDDDYIQLVKNWNKKILIDIIDFYPIEVVFEGVDIKFKTKNIDKKCDLKVIMDLYTLLDIAYGRIGSIKATLSRKLKIKGLLKIGTLLRFMKIFLKSMKMVAADPNTNYFEKNKETR